MYIKINISEKIHPNLGMNQAAEELFDEINKENCEEILIDFSNVIFMSRSFTQEYLFQKLTSNKKIIELNVPKDIQKMFDVVKNDFEG
ncbi:hypothetical protein [Methanobrevibacter sp.]